MKFVWHNQSGQRLPTSLRQRVRNLPKALQTIIQKEFAEVAVIFVNSRTIRQLNRTYRQHDRVTDVLSFTYLPQPVVGELFICLEQAKRQAVRRQVKLADELIALLVHGLLHLAGYDHVRLKERKVMRELEQRVLKLV